VLVIDPTFHGPRSEEHTSELQSRLHLVCRLLLEKKKKQKVRFNIEVNTNPFVKPNNKDLKTILNYEEIINKIKDLVRKEHHELIEDLAENIFTIIFQNRLAQKVKIKIEKLEIIKNSESVGVEFSKSKI